MDNAYFIGIDVGTQGVRVVMVDEDGIICGSHQTDFELTEDSRREQDPAIWWQATLKGLRELTCSLKAKNIDLKKLKAFSVTSTSGTVLPLDKDHNPLHPAIMYSDDRSAAQGDRCMEVAKKYQPHGYHGFNASSGLSKMVWFVETFAEKAARIHLWAHATDYIIGKLSDAWGITDQTNALKSGYDLQNNVWPDYLTRHLPLKASWLPAVYPSGKVIGSLTAAVGEAIGLPQRQAGDILVAAGMTDGCASQVASGAIEPGSWNTTIGTTLVIKGVTRTPIKDPEDRLYNHLHPEGYWMPGGASNTGADWVSTLFAREQLPALSAAASALIPTNRLVYPLLKKGERFPFKAAEAEGFGLEALIGKKQANDMQADIDDQQRALLLAAGMEGVAYIEKMAFALIYNLSGEKVDRVYTAGGGSNNPTWLTIRSSVLGVPVRKMENVSGAVGAAMLAASKTYFNGLSEAVTQMARTAAQYLPDPDLVAGYQSGYSNFVSALAAKGYIRESDYLAGGPAV